MTLRPCDLENFLRMKEQFIESDHEAIFSDGHRQPIYYRVKDGKQELFVEINYQWFRTSGAPGFARMERVPDAQPPVVETPPEVSRQLQGSTTTELIQDAETKARTAINERFQARQAQQGMPTGSSAFAEAAHRERQIIAAGKGRRN